MDKDQQEQQAWWGDEEGYTNKGAELKSRIAELDAAIQREPNNASLYWERGQARIELGDWVHDGYDDDEDPRLEGHRIMDVGLEDVEKAIALDPGNVKYLKFHANYCQGGLRWRDAIEDYQRIIALEPDDPAHLFTLADWSERAQQYAEAVAAYTELIGMLKRRPDGWSISWFDWLQAGGLHASSANVDELGINSPYSLADVYHNRARCYLALKQYEQAAADYTTLIEHGATQLRMYSNVYAERARCFEMLKQYDKALADYEAAQGVTPEANYAAAKAKILKKMGNDAAAITSYTAAIERMEAHLADLINPQPKPTRQLSRDQILKLMSPQMRAAAEADPTIIERFQQPLDPALGSSIRSMTAGLQQHNNQDGLAEQYRERGAAYAKLGQHQQAAADYSRAIELAYFQKRTSDYTNRGNAYRSLGRYDEALADYNVAIEQAADPRTTHQRNVEGYQRDQASRFAQMVSNREQQVLEVGMGKELIENMKRTFTQLVAQTRQHLDSIPQSDRTPQLKSAYFNRGTNYAMMKQYHEAIADFNAYIALDPDNASAYNNRGNAYRGLDQYEPALADYNRAIELEPNNSSFYNNRGPTYARLGRFNQAFADMRRSLERCPNHPRILYNMAVVLGWAGKGSEALAYLRQALALDPTISEHARTSDDFNAIRASDARFAAEFRSLVS